MKFTEIQLNKMASPISQTEEEKCKNAIRMVRDAMKLLNYTDDGKEISSYLSDTYSYVLNLRQRYSNKEITLLVQGAYANKTNISSESDVDVSVILESTFIPNYRYGIDKSKYGFSDGTSTVKELKDEVQDALNSYFKYQGVEHHDKSIKVIGNTYRVDADVVPAYRYRDYTNDYLYRQDNYIGGIEIHPDSGGRIINYPEQHIKSGIQKNKDTNYKFKRCVRIVKNMPEKMTENGYTVSSKVTSFGLDSLLWNVDNSIYIKYSPLRYSFDEVITFLKNDFDNYEDYLEANAIKKLFADEHTKQAYQQFIKDLNLFFEYDIIDN